MDFGDVLSSATLIARPLLGGTLLWAGIAKVRQRDTFGQTITGFQLLPMRLARLAGQTLPFIEIGIGGLLLIGLVTRWAALAAMLLLIGFTGAVGVTLIQGRRPHCLCFGNDQGSVSWWTVYRNIGLLLLGSAVSLATTAPLSIDTVMLTDEPLLPPVDVELVAVASTVSSGVVVIWILIGEVLTYRKTWMN